MKKSMPVLISSVLLDKFRGIYNDPFKKCKKTIPPTLSPLLFPCLISLLAND